jgi:branched-chain amino acid transport system substrate-binding protein
VPNAKTIAPLASVALTLAAIAALAQTKVTNQGISADAIVIGTHRTYRPIRAAAFPVGNSMKLAVDEINAGAGIHGRKSKADRGR